MLSYIIDNNLENGDTTLVGSDGECRVFYSSLMLSEYIKSYERINGRKDTYKFPDISTEDLKSIVKYLCGSSPSLSDSFIDALDYLQIPIELYIRPYEYEFLSVKSLMKCLVDRVGDPARFYMRVLKESAYLDQEVMDWALKHDDGQCILDYVKECRAIAYLIKKDWGGVSSQINKSDVIKVARKYEDVPRELFVEYFTYLIGKT